MQLIIIFIIIDATITWCHDTYLLVNTIHVITIIISFININITCVAYFFVVIAIWNVIATFIWCSLSHSYLLISIITIIILFLSIICAFHVSTVIILFLVIYIALCNILLVLFIRFGMYIASSHFHKVRYFVNSTHPNLW